MVTRSAIYRVSTDGRADKERPRTTTRLMVDIPGEAYNGGSRDRDSDKMEALDIETDIYVHTEIRDKGLCLCLSLPHGLRKMVRELMDKLAFENTITPLITLSLFEY